MTMPYELKEADRIAFAQGMVSSVPAETSQEEIQRAEALEGVHHGMTLPREEDVIMGTPGCLHCEVLPAPVCGPGTLFLQFSHTYTLGKILDFLARSSWKHHEENGLLTVHVETESLAPLLAPLLDRLTSPEQRDARARFSPKRALPQTENAHEIKALPTFVSQARSAWLLEILRGQNLYSVFQPILRCSPVPQSASPEVFGYECLMRASSEGHTVSPGPMLDMARGAGLLFQLDLAARRASLTGAAQHQIAQKIFINFSPNAIYNPSSCLESTVRMVDELEIARSQVVFEIVESERLPEMAHLQRIVDYYRENGFGVALDDVGCGFSSLTVLIALRPDYVKLDMSLIQNVDTDPAKALVVRKLLETSQELGLQTIAEGIERPAEWDWVRAHGANFVQGYLFARPAVPPPLAG